MDRTSPTATSGASAPGSSSSAATSARISRHASARSRSGRSRRRSSGARLEGRRAPLKSALLDQRTIAGLGNIYVDEALWISRLHPLRVAGSLDDGRARSAASRDPSRPAEGDRAAGLDASRLRAARRKLRLDAGRVPGYGRGGEPCDRCGTPLVRIVVGGRTTTFCPHCQILPAQGVTRKATPRVARRGRPSGRARRARRSRRSARRRSSTSGTVHWRPRSYTRWRKPGSSSSETSS